MSFVLFPLVVEQGEGDDVVILAVFQHLANETSLLDEAEPAVEGDACLVEGERFADHLAQAEFAEDVVEDEVAHGGAAAAGGIGLAEVESPVAGAVTPVDPDGVDYPERPAVDGEEQGPGRVGFLQPGKPGLMLVPADQVIAVHVEANPFGVAPFEESRQIIFGNGPQGAAVTFQHGSLLTCRGPLPAGCPAGWRRPSAPGPGGLSRGLRRDCGQPRPVPSPAGRRLPRYASPGCGGRRMRPPPRLPPADSGRGWWRRRAGRGSNVPRWPCRQRRRRSRLRPSAGRCRESGNGR